MPRAAADFRRLLGALNDKGVEFIVVGGVAAVIQGAPIATFDLDIVPELSDANIEALGAALADLDAVFRQRPDLKPAQEHLRTTGHKLLATSAGPLDVLGAIGKGQGYSELVHETLIVETWNMRVRVLELAALIRIKEVVAHEKDLAVLPILRRTLEEHGK